jgi:hypothetical protein
MRNLQAYIYIHMQSTLVSGSRHILNTVLLDL